VAKQADEVVCLTVPEPFIAVGRFYQQFSGISDAEVIDLLRERNADAPDLPAKNLIVHVPSGASVMEGELVIPVAARGLVLFAHGSGSSRHSPRNRFVAAALNTLGFATLLLDLLTPIEDRYVSARFDISLLTTRLIAALDWSSQEPYLLQLPVGLFGASTGAAAALRAAATRPEKVNAVVSRSGRPDLAGAAILATVHTPTLLIVGGEDRDVLALNYGAQADMPGSAEIVIIDGATHLFEEAGTLEQAARAAGNWFLQRLHK